MVDGDRDAGPDLGGLIGCDFSLKISVENEFEILGSNFCRMRGVENTRFSSPVRLQSGSGNLCIGDSAPYVCSGSFRRMQGGLWLGGWVTGGGGAVD